MVYLVKAKSNGEVKALSWRVAVVTVESEKEIGSMVTP